MIYYLYGADSYRLSQKVQEIKGRFLAVNHGAVAETADALIMSIQEFFDRLLQQSMFAAKKLFLVENIMQHQEFASAFLAKISQLANSPHIVIIIDRMMPTPKKSAPPHDVFKRLAVALKQQARAQEFSVLRGLSLNNWILGEFKKYQAQISKPALAELAVLLKDDTWRLVQEINKLANYCSGRTIQQQDVKLLTRGEAEAEIFKALDALALGRKNEAWGALFSLTKNGEDAGQIIALLAFQFRNLLMAKYLKEQQQASSAYLPPQQAAEIMGVHPYAAKKALSLADNFSLARLKNIYQLIFEADLKIKNGHLSPEESLRSLVADL